jgi:two-component system, NtrC family, response regulator AtoC
MIDSIPQSATSVTGSADSGRDSVVSSRTSLRAVAREASRQMESRIILETLEKHHWNRRRTAEELRISYRSLMYKMKYCKLRDADRSSGSEADR